MLFANFDRNKYMKFYWISKGRQAIEIRFSQQTAFWIAVLRLQWAGKEKNHESSMPAMRCRVLYH